jgi:ketosteroid isomerase-like protein
MGADENAAVVRRGYEAFNSADMETLLDVDCCLVLEVKDGRITDGREHFYDLHAWDEFWP